MASKGLETKGGLRCGESLITTTNPSSPTYVLVVEDEPFSRIHALNLVEQAGYAAIEASNADGSYFHLGGTKRHTHSLYGYRHAGVDGRPVKLARAIRDRWPPIELDSPLQDTSISTIAIFLNVVDFFPSGIVTSKSFLLCRDLLFNLLTHGWASAGSLERLRAS